MAPATGKCRLFPRCNLVVLALLAVAVLGSNRASAGRPVAASPSTPDLADDTSANITASIHGSSRQIAKNRKLLGIERLADSCTTSDISIFQGQSSPLPNGIPTYSVQIINLCLRDCPMSSVHVQCGWFASAKLVNPKVFRRLSYNDCLVNDGKAIKGGDSINFQYANSFEYPMKVASANSCQPPCVYLHRH